MDYRKGYREGRTRLGRFVREGVFGGHVPRPILVLTTSRSGSTWLCQALSAVSRAGDIPEHIRPEHTSQGGDDAILRRVESLVTDIRRDLDTRRTGGSKIIWDNFPALENLADPRAAQQVFEPLLELNPVIIRLQRQDRVSQAISRYIARSTGHYHQRRAWFPMGATGSKKRARALQDLTYDRAAISRATRILSRAEENLDVFTAALGNRVIGVTLENLEENTRECLTRLAAEVLPNMAPDELERRVERGLASVTLTPTRTGLNVQWKERYLAGE